MDKDEMIRQLESLAEHCRDMIDKDDPESIWRGDVAALEAALDKLSTECGGNDAQGIIRAILAKEGMNQQQLADKAGMIRQSVSQMLNKDTGMRYSSFQRLVDVLGYEVFCRKKSKKI